MRVLRFLWLCIYPPLAAVAIIAGLFGAILGLGWLIGGLIPAGVSQSQVERGMMALVAIIVVGFVIGMCWAAVEGIRNAWRRSYR